MDPFPWNALHYFQMSIDKSQRVIRCNFVQWPTLSWKLMETNSRKNLTAGAGSVAFWLAGSLAKWAVIGRELGSAPRPGVDSTTALVQSGATRRRRRASSSADYMTSLLLMCDVTMPVWGMPFRGETEKGRRPSVFLCVCVSLFLLFLSLFVCYVFVSVA